ncbi:recombinase family protein [Microbaculum marinisediminis]|uniref:Recombinase family protein n=1 Tax=Microbaculum marinisediminis TaxID=2931392 RepID=A0AAW5R3Z7_9HYPH|nr:recombinase family protein [Microbaculum sp. A6E488]MCT8973250.1 recombinase family protein [Microbaculum sp. A6E488]
MSTLVGYARVSSTDQDLDSQLDHLRNAGCGKVFSEKRSGKSATDREQLEHALDYVREGDVFVVTRLDRLARSLVDLRNIVDRLQAKGVGFRVLLQEGLDTTRPEGRLMLHMLGSFAEFERDLIKERQREGIEKAKAKGVYKGRPPRIDGAAIRQLKAQGVGATEIAKRLGVSRKSVYRALE